jgi:hypothetical protein
MGTSYNKFLLQQASRLRRPLYRSCLASPSKKFFMISMAFAITKNGITPEVSF